MTTKAKSLTQKHLYCIHAEAPFFPKGLTVSIQCSASEVIPLLQELATIALQLSLGEDKTEEILNTDEISISTANQTVSMPEIPEGIIAYAKSWGEEWVETDVLERAKRLYWEHGDWEMVYQELLKQDGEING